MIHIQNSKLRSISPDTSALMEYEVIVDAKSIIQKIAGVESEIPAVSRKFISIKDIASTAVGTVINLKAQIAHMGKVLTKISQAGNSYSSQVLILADGAKNRVCLTI